MHLRLDLYTSLAHWFLWVFHLPQFLVCGLEVETPEVMVTCAPRFMHPLLPLLSACVQRELLTKRAVGGIQPSGGARCWGPLRKAVPFSLKSEDEEES